jgi:D-alanine-D-alanine ligase-like ATP-grasp enzyme
MKHMKIAIVSGGPASEHDVSRNSAAKVTAALHDRHKLISVVINKDLQRWHIDSKT